MFGNSFDRYRGDDWLIERLRKLGSRRTIHEVYGLLHGAIASPEMVMPSLCYRSLFDDKDEPVFDSITEVQEFFGGFMSLWNIISRWDPEHAPMPRPAVMYPKTLAGLKDLCMGHVGFIEYFTEGIDSGEPILPEESIEILDRLFEIESFFTEYARLAGTSREGKEVIEKTFEMVEKLEKIMDDCIRGIHIISRRQRIAAIGQSTSQKIGRNEPCPCGSGKKYKKCCGIVH